MAQSYNLNDVYAIQFGQAMAGILSNPAFPISRISIQQLLDTVEPIAIAATRRIADLTGDMSTAVPPVTNFDTGFTASSAIYDVPQDSAPPPPYVRPTTVLTPGGSRIVFQDQQIL